MPGPLTDAEILRKNHNQEPAPYEVIYEPRLKPQPHECDFPVRHLIRYGTIIRCRDCGQSWKFHRGRWPWGTVRWRLERFGTYEKGCGV